MINLIKFQRMTYHGNNTKLKSVLEKSDSIAAGFLYFFESLVSHSCRMIIYTKFRIPSIQSFLTFSAGPIFDYHISLNLNSILKKLFDNFKRYMVSFISTVISQDHFTRGINEKISRHRHHLTIWIFGNIP
jgi:hypothetical protein